MEKSVKLAVGIYLAIILAVCSCYLAFILVGSLQGKDMSNSVLDSDHSYINNTSRNSDEDVTTSSSDAKSNSSHSHSFANSNYKAVDLNKTKNQNDDYIKDANSSYQEY
ncbi:hypothetical protein [Staphylococcus saccharolyticus]|jgi:hypothetical protein|uniref:Lipoprotein n=1 Tax=Staphylococcus saccharolyticus TaxID=33028 RepID=A0A380H0I2_9STAP|nr:hypothetical protein [Staphylococcus saccharolyticus]MBL7564706.1 hypothetical protein [Staphylococcus saccharolyticus]MBL7571030.1 hypothetical protein [Staphylococcus saccharolyticus]QQB98881.1 hypothetical protein I6I31_02460 [Staphylococcus saccharolyticus]QRJ66904.1 hypothetical protein DMB76_001885 [Staphylococcus saccharolyticus]RTX98356.1 hypothetical protein CD145_02410 [Staphylococcus saccharolyticus]